MLAFSPPFLITDLFQLKYEDKWLGMYELAKISINNRGNEIRSSERRSREGPNEAVIRNESENDVLRERVVNEGSA